MVLSDFFQKASLNVPALSAAEGMLLLSEKNTDANSDFIGGIVNRIAQSDLGIEILNEAFSAGYGIQTGYLKNTRGICHPDIKTIILSDALSADEALSTLIHEARHAGQLQRGCHRSYENIQAQSILMESRLTEADAVACSAGVCAELAEKGDGNPYQEMQSCYPKVTQAFSASYVKNDKSSFNHAMTEAALAWYENDALKMLYEREYLIRPLDDDFSSGEKERPAPKLLEPGHIVGTVCILGTGIYFNKEPAVLETSKYASVSTQTRSWMQEYGKGWETFYNEKCRDPSVDKMSSYDESPLIKIQLDALYGKSPPPITERPEILLLAMRKEKAFAKYFQNKQRREIQKTLLHDSFENTNSR